MAVEIELKAGISNFETVKDRISSLAGTPLFFEKDDCYWITPVPPESFPKSGVRVRRETFTQKDGKREAKTLVTYKSKEVRDGIEVNDEREFIVSDGDTFGELLNRLGLVPGTRKFKEGWAWSWQGITTELCQVKGFNPGNPPVYPPPGKTLPEIKLGWFAELEILAEDNSPETVAAARNRLLEFLDKIGITRDRIEERYYSELLTQFAV
ncbi:CYTH domain-containing protein [Treponema primitia]|nr:CYTH domain-containing protein [Treponema primitia]